MDGREVTCVLVEAEAEAVGGLGGGPGIRRAQVCVECGMCGPGLRSCWLRCLGWAR